MGVFFALDVRARGRLALGDSKRHPVGRGPFQPAHHADDERLLVLPVDAVARAGKRAGGHLLLLRRILPSRPTKVTYTMVSTTPRPRPPWRRRSKPRCSSSLRWSRAGRVR